jgi:hypothetical protein
VLSSDATVAFRPQLKPIKGHTYTIRLVAGDIHGDVTERVITLVAR